MTTTFTKGYKVTLYSYSLRAIALYAIYRNSPNLGCPKGQCEYGHYTLVFDTLEDQAHLENISLAPRRVEEKDFALMKVYKEENGMDMLTKVWTTKKLDAYRRQVGSCHSGKGVC